MSGKDEYKDERLSRISHPGEHLYDHGIMPIDPANHGPISLDIAKRALERPAPEPKPIAKFLHVMNDYILVKMHERDKQTEAGLYLPGAEGSPARTTGIVLGVGPAVGVNHDVCVGDVVLTAKAGGNTVPPGEPLEGCLFFRPASILAVLSRPTLTGEGEEGEGASHDEGSTQAAADSGPVSP